MGREITAQVRTEVSITECHAGGQTLEQRVRLWDLHLQRYSTKLKAIPKLPVPVTLYGFAFPQALQ